jgi:hypothetical protein
MDRGFRNIASTGRVEVSDSSELQLTEGTVIIFGDFQEQENNIFLISKRDAGGTNYELYINASQIVLHDGTNHRAKAGINITGSKYIAVNFADGEIGEAFVDGASVGVLNGASNVSVDDADVQIGNNYNTYAPYINTTFRAALVVNRRLTAAEHASLYSELVALKWPTKPQFREPGGYEWISSWNAKTIASITADNYVPGTPFIVDSGTYKVVVETVNNSLCKVLECTSAGRVRLNMSETHDGRTNNAYGSWELWLSKAAGSTVYAQIVADVNGAYNATGQDGYLLAIGADQRLNFYRTTNGALSLRCRTDASYTVADTWNEYKITRSGTGEWSLYYNGTLWTVSTGTNPTIENTYTVSDYMIFDLDAGDKICLGNIGGEEGLRKHHSVI